MKKEEIHLYDIQRILFGETPPEFMIEVFLRTLIVYMATIMVIRMLGKRMSGQLTIFEMSVLIMMGAIISLPMQAPDRGILQGLLILLFTVVLYRGLNLWAFKNNKIEKLTQGDVIMVVKDGVLQLSGMRAARISRQQLYSSLRNKKIYHLGKVKRAYAEACGIISIYEDPNVKPGLPVLPPRDPSILQIQTPSPGKEVTCCNCGYVQPRQKNNSCSNCGYNKWTNAVIK